MILGLVFSKDRAMQLDAALASFFRHARDASIVRMTVLYKTSTTEHQAQYELLKREYEGRVEFIPEVGFRQQVLDLLISALPSSRLQHWYHLLRKFLFPLPMTGFASGKLDVGHVLFLVDDNIFVRPFELAGMANALDNHSDALGFSLRLGENTTYCYTMNKPQALPDFEQLPGEILKFQWSESESDFAYPLEVSSSIYPLKRILDMLIGRQFQNPNTLELELSKQRSKHKKKFSALLCFKKSVTFCAPINRVQNIYPNRAGKTEELSPQQLAEIFAQGYRINIDALHGFTPNSCHQEVELIFERR